MTIKRNWKRLARSRVLVALVITCILCAILGVYGYALLDSHEERVHDLLSGNLNFIGSKVVYEGEPLVFNIRVNETRAGTLTYLASNLPPGANFDTDTAIFTWTPSYLQSGVYDNVEFRISDGESAYSERITITVIETSRDGDINGDGIIDVNDMDLIRQVLGNRGSPGWIPADLNGDGLIDVLDMISVSQWIHEVRE